MRRFLTLFVLLPIAIVIVALSVANRGPVTLVLDPIGSPPNWSLTVPLFLIIFAAFGLGGLLGGISSWMRQSKWRRAARSERAKSERLQQEVERMHQRARSAPLVPLAPPGPGARDAA